MQTQRLIKGIALQWGIANSLTLLRCVLILPALLFAFAGWYVWVEVIVIIAIISDAEGQYARWTNTATPLGRVFDPLADKAFIDLLLLAYVFMTLDWRVLVLVTCTILYDIDNTLRRISEIVDACVNRFGVSTEVPVTRISKAKTVLLFGTVFTLYLPPQSVHLSELAKNGVIAASLVAVLWSWFNNRKDVFTRLRSR